MIVDADEWFPTLTLDELDQMPSSPAFTPGFPRAGSLGYAEMVRESKLFSRHHETTKSSRTTTEATFGFVCSSLGR